MAPHPMQVSTYNQPLSPHRPPKVLLKTVNAHVTCNLCKGYLIEATTIVECLHSFCHSCIMKHLKNEQYCPSCEIMINKAKPNIKPDATLQAIVYKLVPGLYERELLRKRAFYKLKPDAAMLVSPEQRGADTEHLIFGINENMSLSLLYADLNEFKDVDRYNALNKSIYLQCPALFTVAHLKKYILYKYSINCKRFCVEIMYKVKTIVVPDYYTLMDIAYIYTWKREAPMEFFFRVQNNTTETVELPEVPLRSSSSLSDRKTVPTSQIVTINITTTLTSNTTTTKTTTTAIDTSTNTTDVNVTEIVNSKDTIQIPSSETIDNDAFLKPFPPPKQTEAQIRSNEIIKVNSDKNSKDNENIDENKNQNLLERSGNITVKVSQPKQQPISSKHMVVEKTTKHKQSKKSKDEPHQNHPAQKQQVPGKRIENNIKLKIDLTRQNSVTIIESSDVQESPNIDGKSSSKDLKIKIRKQTDEHHYHHHQTKEGKITNGKHIVLSSSISTTSPLLSPTLTSFNGNATNHEKSGKKKHDKNTSKTNGPKQHNTDHSNGLSDDKKINSKSVSNEKPKNKSVLNIDEMKSEFLNSFQLTPKMTPSPEKLSQEPPSVISNSPTSSLCAITTPKTPPPIAPSIFTLTPTTIVPTNSIPVTSTPVISPVITSTPNLTNTTINTFVPSALTSSNVTSAKPNALTTNKRKAKEPIKNVKKIRLQSSSTNTVSTETKPSTMKTNDSVISAGMTNDESKKNEETFNLPPLIKFSDNLPNLKSVVTQSTTSPTTMIAATKYTTSVIPTNTSLPATSTVVTTSTSTANTQQEQKIISAKGNGDTIKSKTSTTSSIPEFQLQPKMPFVPARPIPNDVKQSIKAQLAHKATILKEQEMKKVKLAQHKSLNTAPSVNVPITKQNSPLSKSQIAALARKKPTVTRKLPRILPKNPNITTSPSTISTTSSLILTSAIPYSTASSSPSTSTLMTTGINLIPPPVTFAQSVRNVQDMLIGNCSAEIRPISNDMLNKNIRVYGPSMESPQKQQQPQKDQQPKTITHMASMGSSSPGHISSAVSNAQKTTTNNNGYLNLALLNAHKFSNMNMDYPMPNVGMNDISGYGYGITSPAYTPNAIGSEFMKSPIYTPHSPIYSPNSPHYAPTYNIPTQPQFKYTKFPNFFKNDSIGHQSSDGSSNSNSSTFDEYMKFPNFVKKSNNPSNSTNKSSTAATPTINKNGTDGNYSVNTAQKSIHSPTKRLHSNTNDTNEPPEKQKKFQLLLDSCNINFPSSLSVTVHEHNDPAAVNPLFNPMRKSPVNYIEIVKIPSDANTTDNTNKQKSPLKNDNLQNTNNETNGSKQVIDTLKKLNSSICPDPSTVLNKTKSISTTKTNNDNHENTTSSKFTAVKPSTATTTDTGNTISIASANISKTTPTIITTATSAVTTNTVGIRPTEKIIADSHLPKEKPSFQEQFEQAIQKKLSTTDNQLIKPIKKLPIKPDESLKTSEIKPKRSSKSPTNTNLTEVDDKKSTSILPISTALPSSAVPTSASSAPSPSPPLLQKSKSPTITPNESHSKNAVKTPHSLENRKSPQAKSISPPVKSKSKSPPTKTTVSPPTKTLRPILPKVKTPPLTTVVVSTSIQCGTSSTISTLKSKADKIALSPPPTITLKTITPPPPLTPILKTLSPTSTSASIFTPVSPLSFQSKLTTSTSNTFTYPPTPSTVMSLKTSTPISKPFKSPSPTISPPPITSICTSRTFTPPPATSILPITTSKSPIITSNSISTMFTTSTITSPSSTASTVSKSSDIPSKLTPIISSPSSITSFPVHTTSSPTTLTTISQTLTTKFTSSTITFPSIKPITSISTTPLTPTTSVSSTITVTSSKTLTNSSPIISSASRKTPPASPIIPPLVSTVASSISTAPIIFPSTSTSTSIKSSTNPRNVPHNVASIISSTTNTRTSTNDVVKYAALSSSSLSSTSSSIIKSKNKSDTALDLSSSQSSHTNHKKTTRSTHKSLSPKLSGPSTMMPSPILPLPSALSALSSLSSLSPLSPATIPGLPHLPSLSSLSSLASASQQPFMGGGPTNPNDIQAIYSTYFPHLNYAIYLENYARIQKLGTDTIANFMQNWQQFNHNNNSNNNGNNINNNNINNNNNENNKNNNKNNGNGPSLNK